MICRQQQGSVTFKDVPVKRFTNTQEMRETKQFRKLMRMVGECVEAGGHFEGFSEYKPVRKFPWSTSDWSTIEIEHVIITLHYKEHPHVTLARHKQRNSQAND